MICLDVSCLFIRERPGVVDELVGRTTRSICGALDYDWSIIPLRNDVVCESVCNMNRDGSTKGVVGMAVLWMIY